MCITNRQKDLTVKDLAAKFTIRYLNADKVREVEELSNVKNCETFSWETGLNLSQQTQKAEKVRRLAE